MGEWRDPEEQDHPRYLRREHLVVGWEQGNGATGGALELYSACFTVLPYKSASYCLLFQKQTPIVCHRLASPADISLAFVMPDASVLRVNTCERKHVEAGLRNQEVAELQRRPNKVFRKLAGGSEMCIAHLSCLVGCHLPQLQQTILEKAETWPSDSL